MKIYIFGSCSGTEPQPFRKHTSFAVEAGGGLYWFDAGEGCSYTAHNMGLNLLKVRAVFISHTHMDHVGGLGNLFWTIRKLTKMRGELPEVPAIPLFIPILSTWEGVKTILKETEGNFSSGFEIEAARVKSGIVFEDETIRVTAIPNGHVATQPGEDPRSFSYKIECEGKTVIFSGDVKSVTELDDHVDGADLLLLETGHHKVRECCHWAKDKNIGMLRFIHHGREILANPEGCLMTAREILGDKADICHDAQVIAL